MYNWMNTVSFCSHRSYWTGPRWQCCRHAKKKHKSWKRWHLIGRKQYVLEYLQHFLRMTRTKIWVAWRSAFMDACFWVATEFLLYLCSILFVLHCSPKDLISICGVSRASADDDFSTNQFSIWSWCHQPFSEQILLFQLQFSTDATFPCSLAETILLQLQIAVSANDKLIWMADFRPGISNGAASSFMSLYEW